jgi:hypothetical protein
METTPAPLHETLSVREGMSVGVLIGDVARSYDIALSPSTIELLQDVNHFFTHLDSRFDGDKPNSVPKADPTEAPRPATGLPWARWIGYLAGESPRESFQYDGQLTDDQADAFMRLRKAFDVREIPKEDRAVFGNRMLTWVYAVYRDNDNGKRGYAEGRQDEGRYLARAFLGVLPKDVRAHPQFSDFQQTLEHLVAGYKLFDSFLDLGKDRRNHNTAIRSEFLGRVALLPAIASRAASVLRRCPGLLPVMIRKALAAGSNADDSRNAERTRR